MDAAQGELLKARIYPFNPELHVEPGFGSGRAIENGSKGEARFTHGLSVNLSQTLEIKGQRGFRVQRAAANLGQVDWSIVDLIRARIEKEVSQAFDRSALQQQIVEEFVKRILPGQEENFKF